MKLIAMKKIEEAEWEARDEGKNLRQWMDENEYEFEESNEYIFKYWRS